MSISIMKPIPERDERRRPLPPTSEEDECPNYETAVSRSNSNGTGRSVQFASALYEDPRATTPLNVSRGQRSAPSVRHERYIYTYRLAANSTPMQFLISVEPESGKSRPGKYTFRLSFKANGIERSLGEPTTKTLRVNPRELDFIVFIFPGKTCLPSGCLWSLRVWLRVGSSDHRIFGEDELWIAKDPDFNSMADASFARLKTAVVGEQVYNAYVGRALVSFTIKWENIAQNVYSYSLEYDANGVGETLFEDYRLRLDGDPRSLTFLIFSIPTQSIPLGASHKLRVWLRSLVPLPAVDSAANYSHAFNDSYIYQRIWKTDAFKIGGRLDFESLGSKMVMAFSSGIPETVTVQNSAPQDDLHSPARSLYKEKLISPGYGY